MKHAMSPVPDGAGASPGDVQYPMFPSLSNMPATRVTSHPSNLDENILFNPRSTLGSVSASIMAASASEPARKAVPRQLDFTSAYGSPSQSPHRSPSIPESIVLHGDQYHAPDQLWMAKTEPLKNASNATARIPVA